MPPTGDFEEEAGQRQYTKPHSGRHPIPTIHSYREHRKEVEGQMNETEEAQHGPEDESKTKRAFESAKAIFKDEDQPRSEHDPYPSTNRHHADQSTQKRSETSATGHSEGVSAQDHTEGQDHSNNSKRKDKEKQQSKSATETVASTIDPKEKRKAMKKTKRHGGGREVTDPVTHLPIIIHDQTEKDFQSAPENQPEPGTVHHTSTGLSGATKSDEAIDREKAEAQRGYNGMQKLFPPPDFDYLKNELATVYQRALVAVFVAATILAMLLFALLPRRDRSDSPATVLSRLAHVGSTSLVVAIFGGLSAAAIVGVGRWLGKKVSEVFEDETWDAARREEVASLESDAELPESVQWLNSLFSSIWPLINPDLFASLVDMIEDVMQASLPKVIKMVSVDDMGQGSEAVRILGVRWLPTGAASQSVGADGQLQKPEKNSQADLTHSDDTTGQGDGKGGDADGESRQGEGSNGLTNGEEEEQQAIREGMAAEDGDFVNLELALSYRSRSSGKSIKSKAKNAHLYVRFYLPGGIAVPIWVELRGIIATMRLRLQLTPDPPFISLCTMTFLGQPKASLSCVPLSKHILNIMDVPLVSSFVQSSIDAALAEYVAPKSLTLNLRDMLVGEDFKKDTTSRGVVWIFIKLARDFKRGDGGIGPFQGSSDSYVTVSWGKFGKPLSSTRVVREEQKPDWHEYAGILVTPEEINADEKLRLQLWDSDKWTADDDLGRVEVDLKKLMNSPDTLNRIQDREDRLMGEDMDEEMAGSLTWSVGYFSKTRITSEQLEKQTLLPDVRTKDKLREHVSQLSEHKLRESGKPSDDEEVKQQKAQDYKELEDNMIISAPPSEEFISGILSIQIHNITGLEVQKLNKQDKGSNGDNVEESEQEDDMPDSYCTIILNHKKIYKTRTKPKNSKPFFNAGTERFVKDWRMTELIVCVRDSREREDDPMIGMIYLELSKLFAKRSQANGYFPLAGGIGYGRARISLVWRSVEVKLPPNLRGWDYGTLEFKGPVRPMEGLPAELKQHRIKIRTNMGKLKMFSQGDGSMWKPKDKRKAKRKNEDANGGDDNSSFLPVRKRYSSAMVIEFRESTIGPDKTSAFAVLWLQDLVDEEDEKRTLKVWRGGKDNLRRAESCCDYDGMHAEEEHLGEVEVNVKFWRGLSGFHKSYASQSKNSDMRSVMECLDTVADEGLDGDSTNSGSEGDDGGGDDDDDDDDDNDDTSSDDGRDKEEHEKTRKKLRPHANDDSTPSNSDSDGEGGAAGGGVGGSSSSFSLTDFKKVKSIFRSPVDGGTDAALSALAPGHNDADDGSRGVRNQLRDYKDHHKQLHRKHRGVMQWRAAREADHLGGKLSRLKGNVSGVFKHSEKGGRGVETEV